MVRELMGRTAYVYLGVWKKSFNERATTQAQCRRRRLPSCGKQLVRAVTGESAS